MLNFEHFVRRNYLLLLFLTVTVCADVFVFDAGQIAFIVLRAAVATILVSCSALLSVCLAVIVP